MEHKEGCMCHLCLEPPILGHRQSSAKIERGSPLVTRSDVEWARRSGFARGYYCAVAVLLRETGAADSAVQSLFRQGGDPMAADAEDIAMFAAHGLMPPNSQ